QKCGALVGCRRLEFANPHALILPPDVTCWSPSRLRPAAACPRVLHEPAPELRWQLHRAVCEVAPFQVVPVRFWFQPRPHRNQPDKHQSNDLGLLADPLAQRRNDSYTTATAPTKYSLRDRQPDHRWPIPTPQATHRPHTSLVGCRQKTRCCRRRRLQPQRHHSSHLPSAKRSYPWLYTITCPTRVPRLKVMRILHTSDWHLGRSFHNTNMLDAQQHAIDFIVSTITEHDIDLVLLAG